MSAFAKLSLVGAGLAVLAGCASAPSPAPARVAVLPLRSVGLRAGQSATLRARIVSAAPRVASALVVASAETDRAASGVEACRAARSEQEDECALAVGGRLGVSHVVVGAVGALGRTHVVQLKLVQVSTASVARSLEETLFGRFDTLLRSTDGVTERLFGVSPRKWYSHWWVWTLAAAGMAAAVTVPVVLTRSSSPYEPLRLP